VEEEGFDSDTGECLVRVDSLYFRPTEVEMLLGDASKAKRVLGWVHKTTFKQLVRDMVAADRALLQIS